ncbi:hypothetical protein [Aliidiomarina quisquiliarum]|uniref:ATP-dependent DNA ligase n=1 Tax=Aliidiomarina quisquiliarum TaxID=2938947 RepID=UPI00208EBA53|nr:hypothetical protein [Aliidiomarina quisquiliarum]MCO4319974.1 hypothetical protein [Aliidiomarina quisquiliarum]
MTAFEATLFINHSSGKTGSWQIIVEALPNGHAQLTTHACKVVGGTPVINTRTVTEGKNIGRSNETTPLEQAISEAKSKVGKKIDKGYSYEQPEAGTVATNGLGLAKPMLAYEFSKVGRINYPAFAQPKLDGNRCLAARVGNEILLWSRGGKFFDLPHIKAALEDVLTEEGIILDGELYIHGQVLQTINALIKKPHRETTQIQYHVYDLVLDQNYQERLCRLETLINDSNEHIVLCETHIANSEDELMELHARWVGAGYEGTIVRDGNSPYQNKRSKSLVKVKDFQDDEFEVLSVLKGTPRTLKCGTVLQCAIYECCAGNGSKFRVTAPGDMHQKHEAFLKADTAVGRPLTVKYFNKTKDGVPFLPVAISLRPSGY